MFLCATETACKKAHLCFQNFKYLFFGFHDILSPPLHFHMWIYVEIEGTFEHISGQHQQPQLLHVTRARHLSLTWLQSSVWMAILPEC